MKLLFAEILQQHSVEFFDVVLIVLNYAIVLLFIH